ncbi:bifunctional 2-polyprenyl-6-hydroxyphenol methylase/3-demethylubiquinol 3-O-methyltransferase UbiG [Bradyrhizobium neotropicale]|uniref:class I SAM-dependent methyltransferase n=1 Tax=Bradyrhizobium neotropicale TaxID=1497615 RepID=UPI001AD623C6|nr:class I SAM-dependent methyltransferase [Bradyrhizobium neotropicale]MBO4223586.1 methyltransferase domain-containing protein [Bradyrhizobium neotropicale]
MTTLKTKETQYQVCVDAANERGYETLGLRGSESWYQDPKHLVFRLSRYKFVAKMLAGRKHVLEVGCGDAFGSRIVQAEVGKLTAIDFDPVFVEDVKQRMVPRWQFDVRVHDMLEGPVSGQFDAVYSLDVLEHIDQSKELQFLKNAFASLDLNGAAVIGLPSLESQPYASVQSKLGHVNCKSAPELRQLMEGFFHNVFIFSMNDEVVHTGFHKMANYVFAIGAGKRA